MKLANKNLEYFGLDIGTSGVRMVELARGDSLPKLSTYGSKPLEHGMDSSNVKSLAKAVRTAKSDIGIQADRVVVAIPNRHAFTTVITTPKLDTDQLKDYVSGHVADVLPMPLEEVRLDWHVINPQKAQDQMDVLIVAAQAEIVDHYVAIVDKAKLKLQALEINALALSRSVVNSSDRAVVVVDLGSSDSEITVLWRRSPHVISSVDAGTTQMRAAVAGNFNVDEDQAMDFLQKFGVLDTKLEGQVEKSIAPLLAEITSGVTRAIGQFSQANPDQSIKKVILTGGPTALPGIPSYIANKLNMPVEIANPWMNVVYPAVEHDKLMSDSLYFAVAVGLAQRVYI